MNVKYWMTHPDRILPRIKYWAWERRNPDKPWLCPSSVHFCDRNLNDSMVGLEFGSGRSTGWFAQKLGKLTSVEHHSGWYDRVSARLNLQNLPNIDYRLMPLDHPESEPERSVYPSIPGYVAVADEFSDGTLDLVVVDGHYRTNCIRRCLDKVRPGGFLLVDDIDLWPDRSAIPVPPDWSVADLGSNGIKRTCIWRKPS